MDAIELFTSAGKTTGCWICGKCKKVTLNPLWHEQGQDKNTREAAELCCRTPVCKTCGKEFERKPYMSYRADCEQCGSAARDKEQAEREQRQLAAAEDVTATYDGPVYIEGSLGGDWGDGFYSDVATVADHYEGEGEHPPEWAFCCKPTQRQLDIYQAIEILCDDGYEDMGDRMTVPESLTAAVAEFNRVNEQALTVWQVDYQRKIRVRATGPIRGGRVT